MPGSVPACQLAGLATTAAVSAGGRAPLASTWPVGQVLLRMVSLEEQAMARDIQQYNLYSCRPRVALFPDTEQRRWVAAWWRHWLRHMVEPHRPRATRTAHHCAPLRTTVHCALMTCVCMRRYSLQDWPGEPCPAATWATYRGPSLTTVMEHQQQGQPQQQGQRALLAVVEVPGLPEHRPLLVAGDALYFRLADHASEEYAGARAACLWRCCSASACGTGRSALLASTCMLQNQVKFSC